MNLLINSENLNKFDVINTSLLSTLNKDNYILVKFINKKELYYVCNNIIKN